MAYDGFISYSHSDTRLATAIQAEVQRFAKPFYKRRALHLFRDETALVTSPELWPSIERALEESEWFVLLASPEAAASRWVGKEIEWWLEHRDPVRILPVVTSGTWIWDETEDRLSSESTAAHPVLLRAFANEPRHLDLTWIDDDTTLSVRDPAFRSAVADLAAPLRGIPKDDLVGEDVRRHRQAKRLAFSAVSMLVILLVVAVVAALLAIRAQKHAEQARQRAVVAATHADAARMSTIARVEAPKQIDVALLLAVEAMRFHDTVETRGALLDTLNQTPEFAGIEQRLGGDLFDLRVRPDREAIALSREDGTIEVWPMHGDEPSVHIPEQPSPVDLAYSHDGRILATAGSGDPSIELRDSTGDVVVTIEGPAEGLAMVAFTPDDSTLVGAGYDGRIHQWRVRDGAEAASAVTLSPNALAGFAIDDSGEIGYFGTTQGEVAAVELGTGTVRWRLVPPDSGRVWSVALDPSGDLLAVGTNSGGVRFVDPTTGKENGAWVDTGPSPQSWVEFDSTGEQLAAIGFDNAVHVIDTTSRRTVTTLRGASGDGFLVTFLDSRNLFTVSEQVFRWNLDSAGPASTIRDFDRPVTTPVRTTDGTLIACDAERPAILRLPDEGTTTEVLYTDGDLASCDEIVRATGSDRIAVVFGVDGSSDVTVRVLDLPSGELVMGTDVEGDYDRAVALSPSGAQLAVTYGTNDPSVSRPGFGFTVSAVPSGRELGAVELDAGAGFTTVAFPDETSVIVGGLGMPAPLSRYDIASGRRVAELSSDSYGIHRVDTTPDGQSIVAAMESGATYVADTGSAGDGTTLRLFQDRAEAVLVGHDIVGVSAYPPEALRLGESRSGRTLGLFGRLPQRPLDAPPLTVGLTPLSAAQVLLSSGTTTTWEFSTDPDDWVATACRVVGRSMTPAEWKRYVGARPYRRTCG